METTESWVESQIYRWISTMTPLFRRAASPTQAHRLVPLKWNLAEPTVCRTRNGLVGWQAAKVAVNRRSEGPL